MDHIDVEKPETAQEKLEYIVAIRKQEMAYFMASSDGGVALLADTLEDVQVSGFEPEYDTINVILTDGTGGDYSLQQIMESTGKRVKGIAPVIVGRYSWRLGFALETYDGGMMLMSVMTEEDSHTVVDTLHDIGHIYLTYRSGGEMKEKMEKNPEMSHLGRLIGRDIDLEYLVNNLITGHLERIPQEQM